MWHVCETEDVHIEFWWVRPEGKRPLGRPRRRKYYGVFNLLKTKHRLLYLKTQSVPRSKHF